MSSRSFSSLASRQPPPVGNQTDCINWLDWGKLTLAFIYKKKENESIKCNNTSGTTNRIGKLTWIGLY